MSIIRTFGELAQEFLEQEVEDFEYKLATEGRELVVDENEWRKDWEGFGSYDPLINLTLYLDGGKEVCFDCLKAEGYSIIHEKLDAFLVIKNDPIYLNIDKSSGNYKVLARYFLLAEIEALGIMEEILQGVPFEYSKVDDSTKSPPPKLGMTSVFSSLTNLQWEEVTFKITDNDTIEIKAHKLKEKFSFQELGFKDKRSDDKPTNIWHTLLLFGNLEGVISWENCNILKDEKTLKKDVQRIGKKLKDFMGIDESPFYRYHPSRGYKTKFRFHDKRYY
jgi:hypothetical protein